MKEVFQPLKRLVLQIVLLLLCYFLSRSIFVLSNLSFFGDMPFGEFLHIAWNGVRFDLSVLLTINSLYIVLLLLPLPLIYKPWWNTMLRWLFIIVNSWALIFEMSDWAYFAFTMKRATADVLNMVSRKGDFFTLLPHFVVDYWYVPFAFAALVACLIIANRRIIKATPIYKPAKTGVLIYAVQSLRLLLVAGVCVIGIRGGLQRTPIGNSTALQVTVNRYVPVVLNTPFSIAHSYANDQLPELEYYSEQELAKYFNPIKQYSGKQFRKKNVVVIMLESFSKEFTGLGSTSYTPFLDSLMQHGYVCKSAYANALHSAEGIPAVIAGIPSLMEEPFTTSIYGTNKITALPGLLKQEGYNSAFFHGGTNGTMSFDVFAANAGYDKYCGRTEYNNDKDYDGNWGIWDEPYLQYFANSINKMPQPFFASVFTLSSHDPFAVPEQYKKTLPRGRLDLTQTIAYTDMALRKFFATASQQPWYNNTLFVITPDHCALLSEDPNQYVNLGLYSIPLLYFCPSDSNLKGSFNEVTQQMDILPSVMDYLGYDKPFFAFGNSIFSNASPRFTINEINNRYEFLMNGYLLKTETTNITEFYNFAIDNQCSNNLLHTPADSSLKTTEPYFRAFIQLYNSTLIHNKMYAPQSKKNI